MITEKSDLSKIEIPVEISALFRKHYDRNMITDSLTELGSHPLAIMTIVVN